MVMHTCNPRTWETEGKGLPQGRSYYGLHSKFQISQTHMRPPSQKQKDKR